MELSQIQKSDLEAMRRWACCLEPERRFWAEIRLASARAIMQKFVDKVDRGMARSADGWIVRCDTETYAEMKQWMEDE